MFARRLQLPLLSAAYELRQITPQGGARSLSLSLFHSCDAVRGALWRALLHQQLHFYIFFIK
jgi:hypothetical protein